MSLSSESDLKEKLEYMSCLKNNNDDSIIANHLWGRTITEENLIPIKNKKYKKKVIVIRNNFKKKNIQEDIKNILIKNRFIFFKIFRENNLDPKIQNEIIREFVKNIYLKKYHF